MISPLERDWAKIVSISIKANNFGKKNISQLPKKHLDDPQAFLNNVLWIVDQEAVLFGKHPRYTWLKTHHNKNIISAVKHGGGSVMV